ncbi:uncharacterized protein F5891DRAFT_979987 [Suillus fuscotomentosus]|uniref:Uncharacterized protein n=1 Tax=Suillus fuscotomentosus TaxID=1912939 RepID=A0AAD4E711_9AGAM|nr:uncharacterized protein F5891DRAFT_979987 [Suillus fuscotomentosus]KAG1900757.1 hypothetical protein F5891DRAFT_979987 [Suillus fuscotomentosus]
MSLPEYQLQNTQALYNFKCYMYKETFPCVMPLLGNLTGVIDTLHFIGYVAVGQHPVLCPLYCSPLGLENIQQHIRLSAYLETGHIHAPALEVECTEVPLYTIDRHISLASLDLPTKRTRQGQDKKIHIVYDGIVDLANFRTIVHWADYPLGYNMPIFNFDGIPDVLEVHSTVLVNDHSFFNGLPLSDVNMASEGDGSFSAYSHHGAPYPTHSAPYIAHSAPHPTPAASQTLVDDAHDTSGQVVPQQPAVNLKQIMIEYSKWRVAICMGNSVVNPHEITTSDADVKANLIATLFSQSLKHANTLERWSKFSLPKCLADNYKVVVQQLCKCFNPPTFDMVKIISTFSSTPIGHLTNVFLGIERTKDALASWLGTHGPNILPDSIFIIASVLFGLVDSHDLMSLLETILGEVVKQMQLQQEDSCIQFLKQGGCCVMEEMMYHAQMEISLYSKAIVNLCKELDARNQPALGRLHPNLVLASVNTIGSTEASSHTLNLRPFQPLNDI